MDNPTYIWFYDRQNQQIDGPEHGEMIGGSFGVLSLEHQILRPLDHHGAIAGERIHKPFSVVKLIDLSSVIIRSHFAQNSLLRRVVIKAFEHNGGGGLSELFSIDMNNVKVASIDLFLKEEMQNSNSLKETITLVYQSIVWNYPDRGMNFRDNWQNDHD